MNLNNLENSIKQLEENVSNLKGKVDIVAEQYNESTEKLSSLKELQEINVKAVEFLNLVQTATKERICSLFENVVSKALQFVYQDNDYHFSLEFGRRGSLPTVDFLLQTPNTKEMHNILDTSAGGYRDIMALALRFVLLEVSHQPGFLILDEPEKRLDQPDLLTNLIQFIKETQTKTKRQIIIITHAEEVVESVPNPIILKPNKHKTETAKCIPNSIQSDKINIEPKKKGRGRPKGSTKKEK